MEIRINRWVLILVPVGALLNIALNEVNRSLQSPLFLDSILTAVVAALGGAVPGLATALLTQLGMEVVLSFQGAGGTALPFVFCGFATAAIVGGLARKGKFRRGTQLVAAIGAVTLANAVIGAFTATFVFGGITLHDSDYLVTGFRMGGQQLLDSAFWARIPLNLVDKGIAVGVAFLALRFLGPFLSTPASSSRPPS